MSIRTKQVLATNIWDRKSSPTYNRHQNIVVNITVAQSRLEVENSELRLEGKLSTEFLMEASTYLGMHVVGEELVKVECSFQIKPF